MSGFPIGLVDDMAGLHTILGESRTIAVVGLSANWHRPSFFAAKYMQDHEYQIIPVNPNYPEVLGRKSFASLANIGEPVDIVDCFRKSEKMEPIARTLYGGTYSQLAVTFAQFGIDCTFVDADRPLEFELAIRPNTKALYAETIANPQLNVLDIRAVADVAHRHDLPLIIDNTLASPFLCRPFEHGADIVVHSATKYIGGHGTSMGGVVVESGKFPWDNGKFPQMTEPSQGYHGVRFFETFGDFGFTMKMRMEIVRTLGPTISPFNSLLLLQGLETLHLRMPRHCHNALQVAEYLGNHRLVAWVNYPGLPSSPYHALAQRYLPRGAGAIISFGIKGNLQAGIKFIEACRFLSHLANVGDAKTLVIHPASTTHRQLDEAQQIAAGVRPEMIRLSIGLEDLDDILWDIDQALAAAGA